MLFTFLTLSTGYVIGSYNEVHYLPPTGCTDSFCNFIMKHVYRVQLVLTNSYYIGEQVKAVRLPTMNRARFGMAAQVFLDTGTLTVVSNARVAMTEC